MVAPPPSKLDQRQILQGVYDEENGRLRTDSVASISNVSIDVDLDPSEDGVFIADNSTGNKLKINADGSINTVSSGEAATETPEIQNIVVTSANTETAIIFPLGSKKLQIKVRDYAASLKLSYEAGDSNINYITIPRGCSYKEENISLTTISRTIYVQSTKPNIVVECITWK